MKSQSVENIIQNDFLEEIFDDFDYPVYEEEPESLFEEVVEGSSENEKELESFETPIAEEPTVTRIKLVRLQNTFILPGTNEILL